MKSNRLAALLIPALIISIIVAQALSQPIAAHSVQARVSAQLSPKATGSAQPADQAPAKLTAQGRLTNANGLPITSVVNVSFKLYTTANGGSSFYTEASNIQPDSNGLFTYNLNVSDLASLTDIQNYAGKVYLGVTVGGDVEMTPRIELTVAPYALSLVPGSLIQGAVSANQAGGTGVVSAVNTDILNAGSTGLYGKAIVGVQGEADTNADLPTMGGYFENAHPADNNPHFGINLLTMNGYGLYASSLNTNNGQASIGVWGDSSGTNGVGVRGSSSDTHGIGVEGNSSGTYGAGGSFNGLGSSGVGVSAFGSTIGVRGYSNDVASVAGMFINNSPSSVAGVFTGTYKAVIGYAGSNPPSGTAYTDGVTGLTSTSGGNGVYGKATGINGFGVWGDARPGAASAIGGVFNAYDNNTAHLALQVNGQGHATGGFSTGLGYGMMVRYDGSSPAHVGDILALDGSSSIIADNEVFGTTLAQAQTASLAVGVAKYRYAIYPAAEGKPSVVQADTTTSIIQPGDFVEVMVLGRAEVKLSGTAKLGDTVSISSSGQLVATSAQDKGFAIGKVVSVKDDMATVFVNFK